MCLCLKAPVTDNHFLVSLAKKKKKVLALHTMVDAWVWSILLHLTVSSDPFYVLEKSF